MKKCMLIFVALISFLLCLQGNSEECTTGFSEEQRTVIQTVIQKLDDLYPGLPAGAKEWFSAYDLESYCDPSVPLSDQGKPTALCSLYLRYKDTEGIETTIEFNPQTLDIVWFTPWDLGAMIAEFEEGISREEAYQITKRAYSEQLDAICGEFGKEYSAFLLNHDAETLQADAMVLNAYYFSPHGPGLKDDPPQWHVFMSYPEDINPSRPSAWESHYWFTAYINAENGDILMAEPYDRFFQIDDYRE